MNSFGFYIHVNETHGERLGIGQIYGQIVCKGGVDCDCWGQVPNFTTELYSCRGKQKRRRKLELQFKIEDRTLSISTQSQDHNIKTRLDVEDNFLHMASVVSGGGCLHYQVQKEHLVSFSNSFSASLQAAKRPCVTTWEPLD